MQLNTRIGRIARVQYALITRRQLIASGMSDRQISRWISSGRLEVVHPSVFRIAGAPVVWEQSAKAATLAAPTSAASHLTAAALWDLVPPESAHAVHISVPRSRYFRLHDVAVHRLLDFDLKYITRRRQIPVTNPMFTLMHLGAVTTARELEDAMERGLASGLYSVAAIERLLAELARRGRDGAGPLGRLLDERALGDKPAAGLLEPRFARLAARYGLPPFEFQYRVRIPGYGTAFIDFAFPDVRVAVEVDGFETHGTARQMERDFDRQNGLVRLGWTVLRFTWRQVVLRPADVAAAVLVAIQDA